MKKKRKRADANQLRVLNATYQRTAFPSTQERESLAKELDMSPRSVQIWCVPRLRAVPRSCPAGSRTNASRCASPATPRRPCPRSSPRPPRPRPQTSAATRSPRHTLRTTPTTPTAATPPAPTAPTAPTARRTTPTSATPQSRARPTRATTSSPQRPQSAAGAARAPPARAASGSGGRRAAAAAEPKRKPCFSRKQYRLFRRTLDAGRPASTESPPPPPCYPVYAPAPLPCCPAGLGSSAPLAAPSTCIKTHLPADPDHIPPLRFRASCLFVFCRTMFLLFEGVETLDCLVLFWISINCVSCGFVFLCVNLLSFMCVCCVVC